MTVVKINDRLILQELAANNVYVRRKETDFYYIKETDHVITLKNMTKLLILDGRVSLFRFRDGQATMFLCTLVSDQYTSWEHLLNTITSVYGEQFEIRPYSQNKIRLVFYPECDIPQRRKEVIRTLMKRKILKEVTEIPVATF